MHWQQPLSRTRRQRYGPPRTAPGTRIRRTPRGRISGRTRSTRRSRRTSGSPWRARRAAGSSSPGRLPRSTRPTTPSRRAGTADFQEGERRADQHELVELRSAAAVPDAVRGATKCGNCARERHTTTSSGGPGSRAPGAARSRHNLVEHRRRRRRRREHVELPGRREDDRPGVHHPVMAAVVRTQIMQAGAIGDPYGSGVRTIWWVYGVGP